MIPTTVTFDTNTLAAVVSPDAAQRGAGSHGVIVRTAVESGQILGFFSETVVTLEGIANIDRAAVLGASRVVSGSSVNEKNQVTLTIGVRHVRKPLESRSEARVQGALQLGMRPLRAAARIGGRGLRGEYPLFEPPGGIPELTRCMHKVNSMTTEIAKRGVGQSIAVSLGLEFSRRAGVIEPELFLQGLGRAAESERKKVAKAVREWSDGDSVAAHYGFGIELFCSDDFGGSGASILDRKNREWLTDEFGIQFVTLPELAQRIAVDQRSVL